jgi:hypothetical protein
MASDERVGFALRRLRVDDRSLALRAQVPHHNYDINTIIDKNLDFHYFSSARSAALCDTDADMEDGEDGDIAAQPNAAAVFQQPHTFDGYINRPHAIDNRPCCQWSTI